MEKNWLTSQELQTLYKVSTLHSALAVIQDWILIILSFWVAIYFNHVLAYLFSMIVLARTQIALGIIIHEAAHHRLFASKFWNNAIAHIFAGAPIFLSLNAYRRTHLRHHRSPLTHEDPDISLTGGYPISRASLKRKLFRDLVGISYFKFAKHFILATGQTRSKDSKSIVNCKHLETMSLKQEVGWMFFANSILFGSLVLIGYPLLYLLLWFLPMITVGQVLLRIRGIAEHAGYQPSQNQATLSRTVVNPFEAFFFAPHQVGYHIEHHIYPSIPFHNLPKAHRILVKRNVLPKKNLFSSYRDVIRSVLT